MKKVVWIALMVVVMVGCRGDAHREGTVVPTPVGDTIIVVGDSRTGDRIYKNIINSIISSFSSANCFIHTGDMITDPGSLKQWQRFWEMTVPILDIMPFYGVVGNHDVDIWNIETQQMYQEVMDLPENELWYSFDPIPGLHCIVLDTHFPGQGVAIVGEQLKWLTRDLENHAAKARFVLVFMHKTPFPQGHYAGHNLVNADEVHKLFVKHRVDAVFAGDEHQYYCYTQDGVRYIVSAGGGAPLYEGGIGEGFYHFLLVEILDDMLRVYVLDEHGRKIQTENMKQSSVRIKNNELYEKEVAL